MIINVSFDLWLTLIKSHPNFKMKRAEMIADSRYNMQGLTPERIDQIIRDLDKIFDRYNETFGLKISATEMYHRVLVEVSKKKVELSKQDALQIEEQANELFIEYNPIFVNDDIPCILDYLYTNNKILNIASNTGYIEGRTLRIVLEKLQILNYFTFTIFSDEINASKPSLIFFEEVYKNINVDKKQVLHIGDNQKTDYQGAINFGFEGLLIKQNYKLDDIRARL